MPGACDTRRLRATYLPLVALALGAALVACGRRAAPLPCREDPARTRRLLGSLGALGDRRVPTAPRGLRVCFDGAPGISGDYTVRLDPSWEDRALAARLGHLLVHTRDGVAREEPPRDGRCEPWVSSMMAREREARGLEASLRGRLGLVPAPPDDALDLESAYRARCVGR